MKADPTWEWISRTCISRFSLPERGHPGERGIGLLLRQGAESEVLGEVSNDRHGHHNAFAA
jgi:hypothetical protein